MRRVQIKVVARPVKIHGQKENCVHSILLTIGLALHKQRLLGHVHKERWFPPDTRSIGLPHEMAPA